MKKKTKPKTLKGRFSAALLDTYLINVYGLLDFSESVRGIRITTFYFDDYPLNNKKYMRLIPQCSTFVHLG